MVFNKFHVLFLCVTMCRGESKPTAEEMDSPPIRDKAVGSDPFRYKMDYPCLGTCLIINNKNFHPSTRKKNHTPTLLHTPLFSVQLFCECHY